MGLTKVTINEISNDCAVKVMDADQSYGALDTWLTPVNSIGPDKPLVRLTGLPMALKQKAWLQINQENPKLAELLKDPNIRAIVELFDADIYVEAVNAPRLPPEQLRGRKRSL